MPPRRNSPAIPAFCQDGSESQSVCGRTRRGASGHNEPCAATLRVAFFSGMTSMSEYQLVHFLALDRPLNDAQMEFMSGQSSRAKVTRWEFTNEYHFGSFHGRTREIC